MGQGEGGILLVETSALPGMGSLRLMGSLGNVCAVLFASNCVDVLTLFLCNQKEWRASAEQDEEAEVRTMPIV